MNKLMKLCFAGLGVFVSGMLVSCGGGGGGGGGSSSSNGNSCLNPGNFAGVYQNTFTTPDGYTHDFSAFVLDYNNTSYLFGVALLTATSNGEPQGSTTFSGTFATNPNGQCQVQLTGDVTSDIPGSPLGVGGTSTFDSSSNIDLFQTAPAQMNLSWPVPGGSAGGSLFRITTATLVPDIASGSPTVIGALQNVLSVSPPRAGISVGSTQQYAAVVSLSDGTVRNVTTHCIWSSSSPVNAAINSQAVASGVAAGSTTITARFSKLSGTAALVVN